MTDRNLIKRAGAESEYTPENIQELMKCKKDPIYFIRKYIWIQHGTKGKVLFDLYDYQEELIRACQDNRWTLALLSRQMGKCFLKTSLKTIRLQPSLKKSFKMAILYIINKKEYDNVKQLATA